MLLLLLVALAAPLAGTTAATAAKPSISIAFVVIDDLGARRQPHI
jgi:hypothetical protein